VTATWPAALVFFVRHEGRAARPLVPNSLVRRPGVVGGNLPAFSLAVICGSPLAPLGLTRIGARAMLLGGFCGVVGGIGLLLTLPGKGCRRSRWLVPSP